MSDENAKPEIQVDIQELISDYQEQVHALNSLLTVERAKVRALERALREAKGESED